MQTAKLTLQFVVALGAQQTPDQFEGRGEEDALVALDPLNAQRGARMPAA